jgi:hypothetical protein
MKQEFIQINYLFDIYPKALKNKRLRKVVDDFRAGKQSPPYLFNSKNHCQFQKPPEDITAGMTFNVRVAWEPLNAAVVCLPVAKKSL